MVSIECATTGSTFTGCILGGYLNRPALGCSRTLAVAVRLSVQAQRRSNRRGRAGHPGPPESVADDRHRIGARSRVRRDEIAAERRLHAEQGKNGRPDTGARHGVPALPDREGHLAEERIERFEGAIPRLPIREIETG